MACPEIPQQPQLVCQKATPSNPAGCDGGPGGPTEGDLECLVCREPYSGLRPPKLLGCQHAFCAVCLKLLLCVQDDAWSIPCPLCRKVTAVPGGLVCTLRDQEKGLANPATLTAGQTREAGEEEQDLVSTNRAAARRLAAHLLLLVLLIVLILPFIYPGVIRWVLSFLVTLALLLALLFCSHPGEQGGCVPTPRTLFCRERKPSEIASIS
ncbi:PREDICTED: RING finger protein 186 [Bison bison bison]|uniref:RING finger protein 186 n=1 Tax=Bison bison bison TaxID=43346 RepID=A0A6P3GNX4_BISBB|nr:PREDICTED: RING finger protein 186 [Bison bison bison]